MSNHYRQPKTRRDMLTQCGVGFGALAFAALFGEQAQAANVTSGKIPGPLAEKLPMFAPKAKRVIFLFMHGGPSQVDTFDPKPLLTRDSGKPFPGEKPRVQFAQTGNLLRSPWEFKKYGQSGIEVSDLFPHIAQHVDDMCVIRSMYGSNPAHGGALLALHTGSDTFIRPSMGSWITYGLGTENQTCPALLPSARPWDMAASRTGRARFCPPPIRGRPSATPASPPKPPRSTTSKILMSLLICSGCSWTCSRA